LDHSELLDKSRRRIHEHSKSLMDKCLDREKVYYGPSNNQSPRGSKENIPLAEKSNSNTSAPRIKGETKQAQMRWNNPEESAKLKEIEQQLKSSKELRLISIPRDMYEFEAMTNRDFNKTYETDVLNSGANRVQPILISREARREAARKKMLERPIDEQKVRSFTFS
jgi:hypothetical protein